MSEEWGKECDRDPRHCRDLYEICEIAIEAMKAGSREADVPKLFLVAAGIQEALRVRYPEMAEEEGSLAMREACAHVRGKEVMRVYVGAN